MKSIFFCALFTLFSINAQAVEPSECDGKATWQKINANSQDISVRKCDIYGMAFLEVKSQLSEDRCINIVNAQTNTVWKHFYLHKDSIKALGAGNSTLSLPQLKVISNKTKNNRCDIS